MVQIDSAGLTGDGTVSALKEAIRGASRIVAFTGAGISTESGVPDFRSPGSPWTANRPIPFDQYMASAAARAEAWRRKFTMDDLYRGARPNAGHMALVDLYRNGRLVCVITQNIDNLHQESGLPAEAIIELHGNGTYATCLSCDLRHDLGWVRERFDRSGVPPACRHCGGIVKSATISFGQAMPGEAMRRAFEAVDACDLFLVLGSSLVVQPAARLPALAKARGAVLVIVNRDPTPLDQRADLVVRSGLGEAIGGLAR